MRRKIFSILVWIIILIKKYMTTMSNKETSTTATDTEKKKSIFEESLDWYIQQTNAIIDSMPIVFRVLTTKVIMSADKLKTFLKKQGIDSHSESSQFPMELYGHYNRLNENMSNAYEATMLYPCNIVVSLVSVYDAFIGNLIKAIYLTTPDKLKECNREISIKELLLFTSIDEAKAHIVEKEAETVLRSSHKDQLEWFGKKLGTSFTNSQSYSKFIEITERRNLYVHTNGTVSGQYIKECSKVKVKDISKIKVGDRLPATPEYVIDCYKTLFEIGVQLGIIVWRKLKKKDEDADNYLNTVCYNLLKDEKYELAKIMLNFATEFIKKPASDEIRRYYIINKALAYYLTGDKNKCYSIISNEDWSASAAKFQLAIAVLNEDYKLAASKMESAKSDINNIAYYEWPLFADFRNSTEFKNEYQKIYGQDFEYTEPKRDNYEEVLQYALDIQDKVKNLAEQDDNANCDVCHKSES